MDGFKICVLLAFVLHCDGVSISEQLSHIARHKAESRSGSPRIMRRYGDDAAVILGAPKFPNHLPQAEAILPGHTLLRPALGMLKSAVKFPHREQESGFGVYGHINNLGIKFDGKNERVLYSGFRRALPDSSINGILARKIRNRKKERLKQLKKQRLLDYNNNHVNKQLTIYPATIITVSQKKRTNIKEMPLKDFHRMITSLRREQEIGKEEPKKGSPFRFGLDSLVMPESEEEMKNKTQIFWETKDAFNHIKINPEAPEHADFLPPEAVENIKNWWYYQQGDFEEFENRRSKQ